MVLFFAACVLYAQFKLFDSYREASGQNRAKLGYFFFSSIVGFIGGCMNFLLAFDIEAPALYSYGTYAVPLFVAATSYSIVRHRLMDITVVLHKGLTYSVLLGLIFFLSYVSVVLGHRASFYFIPPLLAGALTVISGLWVMFQKPQSQAGMTFGLVCLAVGTWLLSAAKVFSSGDAGQAIFWGKCAYVGVVFIPALFYHFSTALVPQGRQAGLIWINYLMSTGFLLLLPTSYLIEGQYPYFWGFYPKAGILHPLFLIFFASAGGISLWKLYGASKAAQQTDPTQATRIQYIFWAFVIGYGASADFFPSYGFEFYPLGYLFVMVWILTVTHAIWKHQFLDISVTFEKPTRHVLLQLLALVPLYLFVLLLVRLFTGSMHYVLAGVLVATFLVLAEILAKLQTQVEQAIGKALFREKYSAYEALSEFSKSLVTLLDLNSLTAEIVRTLGTVLGTRTASLFLLDKEKAAYVQAASYPVARDQGKAASLPAGHALPHQLTCAQTILVREELEHAGAPRRLQPLLPTLKSLGAEVCIPLINKDRLIGFCNLGHRLRRQMYTHEDLNLLTTLAQNAAIALDNALLYEDVRRTQLLMRRTDRLRSLETIAGGFAHEIRNPLTSIKTFIQLAPERKDDRDFMDQFGKVVAEDVDRIERLIQEILDYARYMEPKFTEEDLNEVVSSCLYFVEVKAGSKSITLEKELATDLPPVRLDRQQIKQVLLNLFLNAMEAMGETGGRLTVRTHQLVKPSGHPWMQIEVADTGHGIPAEDLEHIFDPFYTTKHESGQREGTGLGLTIVHQIVQEHGGYIEVDSQVGRGTTFFVNLPAKPPDAVLRKPQAVHEEARPIG